MAAATCRHGPQGLLKGWLGAGEENPLKLLGLLDVAAHEGAAVSLGRRSLMRKRKHIEGNYTW